MGIGREEPDALWCAWWVRQTGDTAAALRDSVLGVGMLNQWGGTVAGRGGTKEEGEEGRADLGETKGDRKVGRINGGTVSRDPCARITALDRSLWIRSAWRQRLLRCRNW
eukprot:GHVU01158486.1.p1 GENE.GHVU01158486.1~~GHVU01158486.1.p1  ORF type:complete len:110 (-),score=4.05 GHVU01158486.1:217-546(-)